MSGSLISSFAKTTAWYRYNPSKGRWKFESYQHGHDYKQKPYGSPHSSHFFHDDVEYTRFAPIHGRRNGEQFIPEVDSADGATAIYHSRGGSKEYLPMATTHPGKQEFIRMINEDQYPSITEFNLGNANIRE